MYEKMEIDFGLYLDITMGKVTPVLNYTPWQRHLDEWRYSSMH